MVLLGCLAEGLGNQIVEFFQDWNSYRELVVIAACYSAKSIFSSWVQNLVTYFIFSFIQIWPVVDFQPKECEQNLAYICSGLTYEISPSILPWSLSLIWGKNIKVILETTCCRWQSNHQTSFLNDHMKERYLGKLMIT